MIALELKPQTKTAEFGLRKTALSFHDGPVCKKCSLRTKTPCPAVTVDLQWLRRMEENAVKEGKKKIVVIGASAGADVAMDHEVRKYVDRGLHLLRASPIFAWKTGAVKCNHDKSPTKKMMECCEYNIRNELEIIKPDLIICLGKGPAGLFNLSGKQTEIQSGVFAVNGVNDCSPYLIITPPLDKVTEDPNAEEAFLAAFRKVKTLLFDTQEAVFNYGMFESAAEFSEWVDKAIAEPTLVFASDIETTTLNPYAPEAKVRSIAFSWQKNVGRCVPFENDPEGYLPVLKRLLETPTVQTVWHNAPFDVPYLRVQLGIKVAKIVGDTQLMAYLLDPRKGVYGYGLKPLAQEYTNLGKYDEKVKDQGFADVDILDLATYNQADTDSTYQLYRIFHKELSRLNMLDMLTVINEGLKVIIEFHTNGVLIDREWLAENVPRLEAVNEKYLAELNSHAHRVVDWNSNPDLAKFFFDELKLTNPFGQDDRSTGDEILLRWDHPAAVALRKYRTSSKILNTYFNGYFAKTDPDGRIRGRFNLQGTATGRMSSTDPNFQNIMGSFNKRDPWYEDLKDFKVKNVIVPERGWTMVQADQSQLEIRVACMVSKDPSLCWIYNERLDMHSENALVSFPRCKPPRDYVLQQLASKGIEDNDPKFDVHYARVEHKYVKENYPTERAAAKSVSFGVLYGMSAHGLRYDLDNKTYDEGRVWSLEECQSFIDSFNSKYPVLANWIRDVKIFAQKHGYTYNLLGFRRPLPDAKLSGYNKEIWQRKSRALRAAANSPIQGLGFHIMLLGMVRIQQELDLTKAKLLMNVHDSVVLEIRNDYLAEALPIIKRCLENPLLNGQPLGFINVPLVADLAVGPNYGSVEEINVKEYIAKLNAGTA